MQSHLFHWSFATGEKIWTIKAGPDAVCIDFRAELSSVHFILKIECTGVSEAEAPLFRWVGFCWVWYSSSKSDGKRRSKVSAHLVQREDPLVKLTSDTEGVLRESTGSEQACSSFRGFSRLDSRAGKSAWTRIPPGALTCRDFICRRGAHFTSGSKNIQKSLALP